jgi:hypothetical protein
MALNEPYPVYDFLREDPGNPTEGVAVPGEALAFAVEDGLKVQSTPFRNLADSCYPS